MLRQKGKHQFSFYKSWSLSQKLLQITFKRKKKIFIWQHTTPYWCVIYTPEGETPLFFLSITKYSNIKKNKHLMSGPESWLFLNGSRTADFIGHEELNGGPVYLWRAINDVYSNTSLIVCTKHHGIVYGQGFYCSRVENFAQNLPQSRLILIPINL